MLIVLIGLVLWLFFLSVLVRLGCLAQRLPRQRLVVALLLLLVALPLFFRPHEKMIGGQDGYAYRSFGLQFARQPTWRHQDPLLAEVPQNERSLFLVPYYPPCYSKLLNGDFYAEASSAEVGFWFQPAYPLMMGFVNHLHPVLSAYVAPLFALCTAFVLFNLCAKLFNSAGAGIIGLLLYLANPAVIWHGRHPRPEVLTSFLVFSGMLLLLLAFRRGRAKSRCDLLLAACCINLAPFFHISALMVALPTALTMLLLIASGRDDVIWYFAPALIMGLLFLGKLYGIHDTYHLLRFVRPLIARPLLLLLLIGLAIAGLGFALFIGRSVQLRFVLRPTRRMLRAVLIVLPLVAYLTCYAAAMIDPPTRTEVELHYVNRTDLRAVLNVQGPLIALAALSGLCLFAATAPRRLKERILLLACILPATLMLGNMYDFFMYRYTLVVLQPLLTIGLVSLVMILPVIKRAPVVSRTLVALCIAAAALYQRTHLVTMREYCGLGRQLSKVAASIPAHGRLLVEYGRLAAPFEYRYGLSTLPLYTDSSDYAGAEQAWAGIMRREPDQPYYFLTIYEGQPCSPLFSFTPVQQVRYTGLLLKERYWDLPRESIRLDWTMRLYRMHLHDPDREVQALPYMRRFDQGRFGLRRFDRTKETHLKISGRWLDRGAIPLTAPTNALTPGMHSLLCFFYATHVTNAAPLARLLLDNEREASGTWQVLPGGWRLWKGRVDAGDLVAGLVWQGTESMLLTRALLPDTQEVLFDGWRAEGVRRHMAGNIPTRWARNRAELTVPASDQRPVLALMFMMVSGPGTAKQCILEQTGSGRRTTRQVATWTWTWQVWNLEPTGSSLQTLRLHVDPVFDPGNPKYQPDLAAQLGLLAVIEE